MPLMKLDDQRGLNLVTKTISTYVEDWERFSVGDSTDPLGYWELNDGQVDDTRSLSQSLSYRVNTGDKATGYSWFDSKVSSTVDVNQVQYAYNETNNSTQFAVGLYNSEGNRVLAFGTNNPQVDIWDDNGLSTIESSPDPDYDEWRRWTVNIDEDTWTYDATWEDVTGNTSNASQSGSLNAVSKENIREVRLTNVSGQQSIDAWIDDITGFQS